jgi:hypothetical protein
LWDETKPIVRGKITALKTYIKNETKGWAK